MCFSTMKPWKKIVETAENLAGFTTILLIILGIIQIILGETISKSIALTANGIDCIGDGFVSGVVWVGLRLYKKPANQKFKYGYYKMENLASALAAIVMISLALYIMYRSYNQLLNPHPVELPLIGAVVASIAAAISLGLGLYKYLGGTQTNMNSVRLEAFNTIKDGTASALTVVALILTSQGFLIADSIVGFIIAGIICTIGFAAIKESSYMLVDACDGECINKTQSISSLVQGLPGVVSATVLRMRQSGPVFQGDLEVEVSEEMTIREFNALKKMINLKIKESFPDIEKLTITPKENQDKQ